MKRIKILMLVGLLFWGAMSVSLASDNFGELNVKTGLNLSTGVLVNGKLIFDDLEPCVSLSG